MGNNTSTGFDILNYSATLIQWAKLPVQTNVFLDGSNNLYEAAREAYTTLVNNYNWTISPIPIFLPTPDLIVEYKTPTTQNYNINFAIQPFIPTFLSNFTDVVFTVSPNLPEGLIIDRVSGIISGTPTVLTDPTTYTVLTTANQGSVSATSSLLLSVINVVTYFPKSYTFLNTAIITNTIHPTVAEGLTISSYTISPALPIGFVFNKASGVIGGTPAEVMTSQNYTLTAIYNGTPYESTIAITVVPMIAFDPLNYSLSLMGWVKSPMIQNNVSFTGSSTLYLAAQAAYISLIKNYNWTITPMPTFLPTPDLIVEYNQPTTQNYNINFAIQPYTPSFLSNFTDVVFTVSPDLPLGLIIDPVSGTIRGTPTVLTDPRTYNVQTSANQGSVTVSSTLILSVINVVTYYPVSYTLLNAEPMVPITPTVAEGLTITRYAIRPALTAGFSFDPNTGFISGTPSSAVSATYVITATYDDTPYENTITLTIDSTTKPLLLDFVNVPLNFAVVLPLSGVSADAVVQINWGDGSALTTNKFTHNYNRAGNYTVKVFFSAGTVARFGSLSWPGSTFLKTIADWANLPGIRSLNYLGTDALTTVPSTLPPTVTDLSFIFAGATQFNQDISGWDLSPVLTLTGSFYGATNFNQPLASWNVGKVTDLSILFDEAKNFNQDLSRWNVGQVTTMLKTFYGATNFNQDLSRWDVSQVTSMNGMFYGATNFNQNLGNWNVYQVTTMEFMFADAVGFDTLNYSTTLIGWANIPNLQYNVKLTGAPNLYAAAQNAYTTLTTFNWEITPVPVFLQTPELMVEYNQPTTRTFKNNIAIIPYQPSFLSIYSDVVFSITPALPTGLAIDIYNGTISGTPVVFSPATTYTVNTRANVDQISVLSILVLAVSSDFYYTTNSVFLNNVVIEPLVPTLSAGVTISSYAIEPALTGGLRFNTTSGAITGTPTTAFLSQNYTITATKPDTSTTFYQITLNVVDITYPDVAYLYGAYVEFLYSPFNGYPIIPTIYNAEFFSSIVLQSPLPFDLTIDLADGIIFGTPYIPTAAKNYILTATTISGYTKDIRINITVNGFSYTDDGTEAEYIFYAGQRVQQPLLINIGGYTDFISDVALPAGLTLDNRTGTISGLIVNGIDLVTTVYISGLVYPIVTIPVSITIISTIPPGPGNVYKKSKFPQISNAMRYSQIVQTPGAGQSTVATNPNSPGAAFSQPPANRY